MKIHLRLLSNHDDNEGQMKARIKVNNYITPFADGKIKRNCKTQQNIHVGGGTFIGGGGIIPGGGMFTGCPGGGGGAIIGTGTGAPPIGGASANSWCGRSACDSGF